MGVSPKHTKAVEVECVCGICKQNPHFEKKKKKKKEAANIKNPGRFFRSFLPFSEPDNTLAL